MQSVSKMRTTIRGKRQNIVQPEQTLHHFFKNAPQQQEISKSKFTSQEIIVIDSDNDDKLEPSKPAKRRRLSDVDIDLTLGEDWDDDRSFEFNDWMLNPDNENPLPATTAISSNPQLQVSSSSCMVTRQTLVSCDGNVKPGRNNAFSILMSSVKESEAWKEASIDNKTSGPPQTGTISGRRKVPFYKVLQGMPIAVDAFNFGKIQGVTAYFLTSVHLASSLLVFNLLVTRL
jgi:hypothetical protein